MAPFARGAPSPGPDVDAHDVYGMHGVYGTHGAHDAHGVYDVHGVFSMHGMHYVRNVYDVHGAYAVHDVPGLGAAPFCKAGEAGEAVGWRRAGPPGARSPPACARAERTRPVAFVARTQTREDARRGSVSASSSFEARRRSGRDSASPSSC